MRLALLLILTPAMTLFCRAGQAAPSHEPGPVVEIESGRVRGVTREGLMIFKGIPYARPPVGPLRWRPPQPAEAWQNVRPAVDFGHDCMQLPTPGDAAPLRTTPSEDCLYVNVWAPARVARGSLPVMVWIYGGGFVNGGSSPAVYSGAAFARDGLVFVSFNYRLGRFGFFAFPAIEKEGGLVGNYAFMDQIAALKWVQRNIAAFGGNPQEVTIFGESAGGMSVNALLTSPLARGLFERAIVESGGGRGSFRPLDQPGPHGRPSAEQAAVNFAEQMGIHGTGAKALESLRVLPAEKIVNGMNMDNHQHKTYSGPMLDGKLITQSPEQVYKEGQQAKVPVVVGANSQDLGFTSAKTLDELFAPFGSNAAKARAAFDPDGRETFKEVAQAVSAVRLMLEPARFVARVEAAAGQPAYVYRFSYVAAAVRHKYSGAPHSSEIPYAFDTLRKSMWADFGNGITSEDLRIARQMHAYWVNFAKTGNPSGAGLPHWPRITPKGNQLMNFTTHGPRAETDPWKTRLNLVEALRH